MEVLMHISREEYRVTVSKKYGEYIFYILLIGVSFLALLLFGEGGYYEYTDSYLYIQMKSSQGVVPLYPLFIHAHRKILGEEFYLYGVVISQTVLCIACVTCWNIWIRRRFKAGYFILALVYLVSLIPFTIDMPITLINHSILTEALAYPLFYIFVIFFMEAAFRKKNRLGNFCIRLGNTYGIDQNSDADMSRFCFFRFCIYIVE
ncbi:MAG: hypothetical protein ACLTBS_07330 [Eisenbergiella sp.]